MQINIPSDAEPLLKRNAALAGFDDVGEYVLRLILDDDAQQAAAKPAADDPRITRAIDDGYASGVAGDAKEILAELREQQKRRLAAQNENGR